MTDYEAVQSLKNNEAMAMGVIIGIIVLVVGFTFGLFAFAQILFPLFFALPKAKKMEQENRLIKPIPKRSFIIAPIIWAILLFLIILLVNIFIPSYSIHCYISLAIAFIIEIIQIPLKNKDLQDDFNTTWKSYINEE